MAMGVKVTMRKVLPFMAALLFAGCTTGYVNLGQDNTSKSIWVSQIKNGDSTIYFCDANGPMPICNEASMVSALKPEKPSANKKATSSSEVPKKDDGKWHGAFEFP